MAPGLAASALALAIGTAVAPSPARAQPSQYVDIPAGQLDVSIRALARQAGLQVLFPYENVLGRTAPELRGVYDPVVALAILAKAGGLRITAREGRTITLAPAPVEPAEAASAARSAGARSGRRPPVQTVAPDRDTPRAFTEDAPLEEVIVTATKRADTVNRVPMSILAQTQELLERQDIKNAQDLSRTVPALLVTPVTGTGNGNGFDVSIRGIRSNVGAPTTGIYLDDAAIQRRNAQGANAGNGSVLPTLFDLQRVEVLRGPQGTLYGSSSEGGTIRFITTPPSLIRYSAYARTQISYTEDGRGNDEAGVAVGGPIVPDRVGVRASLWGRRLGGYIDHVSRLTGQILESDTNDQSAVSGRVAILVKPTDRLTATLSAYASQDYAADPDQFWGDIPRFTVPSRTTGTFTYPAATYGPYDQYGPFAQGKNCNVGDLYAKVVPDCVRKSPRTSRLFVPSLVAEYDFGPVTAKSITSYVGQSNDGSVDTSFLNLEQLQGGGPFVADLPLNVSTFSYHSAARLISQEARLTSNGAGRRLTWVGGVYFSHAINSALAYSTDTLEAATMTLRRQTVEQVYGAPPLPNNITQVRQQTYKDTEIAAYGDLSYSITEKLRLIGGVRVSRTTFTYDGLSFGARTGSDTPTVANGGVTTGSVAETPVTPRLGLQYQLTPHDMLYFTAAKGFRGGGVNLAPSPVLCAADLAALGKAAPNTFASDSLWSYEAGAKLSGAAQRWQLNGSLFYIDWSNVQVNYALPNCLQSYITNAGRVSSKGFDLQGQARVGRGLTVSGQMAYTDARHGEPLRSGSVLLIRQDDRLPTPPWSYTLGIEYSFPTASRFRSYARMDYQYTAPYVNGFGPGTLSYAPDIYHMDATHYLSARVGAAIDGLELALFVNNALNSRDLLSKNGGRSGCQDIACSRFSTNVPIMEYTTFTPRTAGISLSYRY